MKVLPHYAPQRVRPGQVVVKQLVVVAKIVVGTTMAVAMKVEQEVRWGK